MFLPEEPRVSRPAVGVSLEGVFSSRSRSTDSPIPASICRPGTVISISVPRLEEEEPATNTLYPTVHGAPGRGDTRSLLCARWLWRVRIVKEVDAGLRTLLESTGHQNERKLGF